MSSRSVTFGALGKGETVSVQPTAWTKSKDELFIQLSIFRQWQIGVLLTFLEKNFQDFFYFLKILNLTHCSAATFHYVSVSKPNPVWFGKKSSYYWQTFPNQIQFGLENYCVKFGEKLIPNQVQFGLEKDAEHFIRQKSQTNYRLV